MTNNKSIEINARSINRSTNRRPSNTVKTFFHSSLTGSERQFFDKRLTFLKYHFNRIDPKLFCFRILILLNIKMDFDP